MSNNNPKARCGERDETLITKTVRRRLPAYYRALIGLYAEGLEKVNSKQLALMVGAAETQVKTDLAAIGCKGQRGYGYSIARLYRRIGEVMNVQDKYAAVIIGESALAEAVSQSHLFTKRGLKLAGKLQSVKLSDDGETFEAFCRHHSVDVMIIASEASQAEECLQAAEAAGIKGILNLSEAELTSTILTVRNLHIDDTLMMLCSEI